MRINEEVTNRQYSHRAAMDFPSEALALLRRTQKDEMRHLEWVREALRARLWEERPAYP